jgi:hypothetical protein
MHVVLYGRKTMPDCKFFYEYDIIAKNIQSGGGII